MLSKSLTDGKSLIYIKNSRGPKIEPWGTPVYIFFSDDLDPFRSTNLFDR